MDFITLTLIFGVLAVLYGIWATNQILKASSGTKKMIEIASSIQIGAKAYLNRQYSTIAIVGVFGFLVVTDVSDGSSTSSLLGNEQNSKKWLQDSVKLSIEEAFPSDSLIKKERVNSVRAKENKV